MEKLFAGPKKKKQTKNVNKKRIFREVKKFKTKNK